MIALAWIVAVVVAETPQSSTGKERTPAIPGGNTSSTMGTVKSSKAGGGIHAKTARATEISGGQAKASSAAGTDVTRCEKCHNTSSWLDITFPHEITGFPLRGGHKKTSCSACHQGGIEVKLPMACAACHKDAHAGELGLHCEGCHDETTWRGAFSADAHRRTNFPLEGRHAVIPCEECHVDVRERRFSRAALDCAVCHTKDLPRAAANSIDHMAAGFGTDCKRCHSPTRFDRARFVEHEACFDILRGQHKGIACFDCHTTLMGAAVTGACNTNTAACTACHEHTCSRSDRIHDGVPGYQCKDRKCYECHRTVE